MTIGKRISLGFSVLIVLLLILGSFSYLLNSRARDGFNSYRGMALDNTLSGRIQANLLMMRIGADTYFSTHEKSAVDLFNKRNSMVEEFMKKAHEDIQDPKRAEMVDKIDDQLAQYQKNFIKIQELYTNREAILNGEQGLYLLGPKMEGRFNEIMQSANRDSNSEVTFLSADALRTMLLARLQVVKFLNDNEDSSRDQALVFLKKFDEKVRLLNSKIQSPLQKKLLQETLSLKGLYQKGFEQYSKIITERNSIVDLMEKNGDLMADEIEKIKLSIKGEQDRIGPEMVSLFKQSSLLTIFVSIIAIVTGLILAIVIARSITTTLLRITNSIKNSSEEVSVTSIKLSSSSSQLSSAAVEQASSIEETSSSLEEISGMVDNNVERAEDAVKLSTDVKNFSSSGNEAMKNLQKSMTEILESNNQIEELVEVISNIGAKTQVMDEIVFQTKLLSFNASVEAERAGEHGRGFAVVAQEVGNLAQMSGNSAQEIAEIVSSSIKNAREITAKNREKVQQGSEYVKETAGALEKIMETSVTVNKGSQDVLSASKDQALGVKQINMAMSQLDKATQENAATAEETASTSELLSDLTLKLNGAVDTLNELVSGNKGHKSLIVSSPEVINKPLQEERSVSSSFSPSINNLNDSWDQI